MLETGWGRAVPGNNWYGIKGKGPAGSVTVPTREEFAPGIVTRQRSAFRAYADPAESVRDWARFVTRGQYAPALTMKSPGSAALWIWSQGYATSSRYVPALARWSQIAAQSTGAAALAFELSAAHKALAAQLATLPAGKARKTSARTLLHSGRWPA
jgi:flagellum-specific peptidoglycan hydrolase FlgJ